MEKVEYIGTSGSRTQPIIRVKAKNKKAARTKIRKRLRAHESWRYTDILLFAGSPKKISDLVEDNSDLPIGVLKSKWFDEALAEWKLLENFPEHDRFDISLEILESFGYWDDE